MANLHRAARTLTFALATVTALGLVALPASADPGQGKGPKATDATKAAQKAVKDAQKQARDAQKQAVDAQKQAVKAAKEAAKEAEKAAKAQVTVVVQSPGVVPPTVSVPPVTAATRRAAKCSEEQAKLVLRRSQLDAEVSALTGAELAARSAGRMYEADYLRLEVARVQKEIARVAYELQKKQAECVGVSVPPTPPVTVPPISIPAVPVPAVVPVAHGKPACAGAHGKLTSLLRQIRKVSRQSAHAQAESFRARSRGEAAKADAKLAEATRLQQRVVLLTARRTALASACPGAV